MNKKVEIDGRKIRVHFKLSPVGGHRSRRAGLNKDVPYYSEWMRSMKAA